MNEISVRRISGSIKRLVISAGGRDQPVWRRDGRELFYVDPDGGLRSVQVQWSSGEPMFGLPEMIPVPRVGFGHWSTQYNVSADGAHIYMMRPNDGVAPSERHVVIGWCRLLGSFPIAPAAERLR